MNIKKIYPSEEGDVTEIISMEDAIKEQCHIAKKNGHLYKTNKEAMIDLLQCPCTEMTDEPIGKTFTPRVLTLEEALDKIEELKCTITGMKQISEDCLNIYLIYATKGGEWDTYISAVVVAKDDDSARYIHPSGGTIIDKEGYQLSDWCRYEDVVATYVGKADSTQKNGDVICASFNAG